MIASKTLVRTAIAVAACVATAVVLPGPVAQASTPSRIQLSQPAPTGQAVLTLPADPSLTVGGIRALGQGSVRGDLPAVSRIVGVRAGSAALTDRQISAVLSGRSVDGAELVGTITDPTPDTTVGGATARMKIPGLRVILIHGEIYVDGVLTPVLIIIIIIR